MSIPYYDIIIVGSGISGLYSAYNIKKLSSHFEKYFFNNHILIFNYGNNEVFSRLIGLF